MKIMTRVSTTVGSRLTELHREYGVVTAVDRNGLCLVMWDDNNSDWCVEEELTVEYESDLSDEEEEDLVEAYLNERKWYNFETCFVSLRDELRKFMHDNHITYELSSCGCGYHFEILLHPTEVDSFNDWLDAHSITEVK